MAERFVADLDKAQQVSERLTAVGRAIEDLRHLPQPSGPVGNGVLERSWSESERTYTTAKRNLARDVRGSANGFGGLISDAAHFAQQTAQEVRTIE